ncbi:hypothetical protein DESC_720386 [Desulfosarcina cetonica]|nr:hypothetical protein DESC_720386 [Desulfosarcina cetonica]
MCRKRFPSPTRPISLFGCWKRRKPHSRQAPQRMIAPPNVHGLTGKSGTREDQPLFIAFKIMFLGCVIGRRGMVYTASSLWPYQKHYLKYYSLGLFKWRWLSRDVFFCRFLDSASARSTPV